MHFDTTVNLGNVLTMIVILISAIAWLRRIPLALKDLQTTSKTHDQWIAAHQVCNDRQIAIMNEVRKDLAYLRGVSDAKAQTIPHLKDQY